MSVTDRTVTGRLQSPADIRVEKARRLATTELDFRALLAGEAVPLDRLDQEWARRYRLLCSECDLPSDKDGLCRKHWYARYLASPQWRRVRERKLRTAGRRCQTCGATERRTAKGNSAGLHVHHLTYERAGGHELMDDLQVLCESCHRQVHQL